MSTVSAMSNMRCTRADSDLELEIEEPRRMYQQLAKEECWQSSIMSKYDSNSCKSKQQ